MARSPDGYRCDYCGTELGSSWTVYHDFKAGVHLRLCISWTACIDRQCRVMLASELEDIRRQRGRM